MLLSVPPIYRAMSFKSLPVLGKDERQIPRGPEYGLCERQTFLKLHDKTLAVTLGGLVSQEF